MYRNNYHKSQKLICAERREEMQFYGKSQPARVEKCRRKCMKDILGGGGGVKIGGFQIKRLSKAKQRGRDTGKCDGSSSAGAPKD